MPWAFLVGGLSLLMAALTRYRPPRSINWLYGYRTARSMRTPEAWREGNGHFARCFWRLSWAMLLAAAAAYLLLGGCRAVLTMPVLWVTAMLAGLWRTERHLPRRFDEQGRLRA